MRTALHISHQRPMNTLAQSRLGRVILHALCFLRHPNHLRWHWQGIMREFAH